VTPVLLVELNRGQLHEVEAPSKFATAEAFSLELRNHGEAVHVHVRRDDALSAVTDVDADGNLFVERETTKSVPVGVRPEESTVTGTLEIATGYGSEQASVEITVEAAETGPNVDVDETLSKPPESDPPRPPLSERLSGTLPGHQVVPVLVVGLLAIGVAAAVATSIRSPAVLVGAGVVVGAVLVAVAASLR
jgi:hypothetical protein